MKRKKKQPKFKNKLKEKRTTIKNKAMKIMKYMVPLNQLKFTNTLKKKIKLISSLQ